MSKDVNQLTRQLTALEEKMSAKIDEAEKRADKKFTEDEEIQFKRWEIDRSKLGREIRFTQAEQAREALGVSHPQQAAVKNDRSYYSIYGVQADEQRADGFCRALTSGQISPEFRVSTTGNGPSLGFAIPDEVSAVFFDMALAGEYVRPRCLNFPMAGPKRSFPVFDDETQTSTIFGFTPQWKAEGGTFNIEDAVVRKLSLECKSLGLFTSFSSELSQDGGGNLEQGVKTAMSGAIGVSIDLACTIGSGVGEPFGALNSACRILVVRSSAGHIVYTDILAMIAKLLNRGQKTAIWIVSNSALAELLALKDEADNLLFKSFDDGLLGFPVIVSDVVPSLGTQGDLSLCDFSKYAIGLRKELTFESTNAFHWNQNVIDIRGILRMDGQPIFSKPVTLRNGDTVSPFVILK